MSNGSTDGDIDPIKLADRSSNYDRFDGDAEHIIKGLLHNRQLSNPDDTDGDYLVDSLKYTKESIPRRDFTDLSEVSGYDISRAQRILDIFGENGEQALEFQLDAWKTINEFDNKRRSTGDDQGVVVSAPTGFGKTYAFMGPIYDQILNQEDSGTTILVFPRTALLRDQLTRILERQDHVRNSEKYDKTFSVGTWISGLPWDESDFDKGHTGIQEGEQGRSVFTLADYWDDDSEETELYLSADSNGYDIFNEDVTITDDEFIFPKEDIKDSPPDILLTTLESLELFSLKPNYNILKNIETIVFDEIHQYDGLRGSHAANIIENVKTARNGPLLFLGSSATVDDPGRFGGKLFQLENDHQFKSVEPTENDYNEDSEDPRHHYFLLSREDGPGAASMYIQEMMLLGHSLLDPKQTGEPGELAKILSFIDSKSQIHQREDQFEDADAVEGLWRYHDSDSEEYVGDDQLDDYRLVADNTEHDLLEQPIDIDAFHADSKTSISDLEDMTIIQSTSSLEVGIDIDDIEIVTQYREPLGGLSSFVQRAGRAGREPGTEAHMVTMLSDYAGDTNFYHRADRFLNSDIETPLQTDNDVIDDLHQMSLAFYEEMEAIYKENPSDWAKDGYEKDLLENLFSDRLDIPQYYRFLTETSSVVSELSEWNISVGDLRNEQNVSDFEDELTEKTEELDDKLDEIIQLHHSISEEVLRGDDPVNGLLDEVSERVQRTLTKLEKQTEDSDIDDEVRSDIESIRQSVRNDTSRDPKERLSLYNELVNDLTIVIATVSKYEDESPDLEQIQQLTTQLGKIEAAADEGVIEQQQKDRKSLYFLRQAVEQISDYVGADTFGPHGSLHYMKNLFRGAYFFDQFLRLRDEEPVGLNYYPDNYFGGGGKSFTLKSENRHEDSDTESIDTVINQFAPYKSQYLPRTGEMHVNVPDVITSGETPQMNFSNVPGRVEDGIKIPDQITMSDVRDVTENRSQGIVVYDTETYRLYKNYQAAPPGSNPEFGKVHSEPHVETNLNHVGELTEHQGLSLGDANAEAAIDSVTLEISTTYWNDEAGERRFDGNKDEVHLESTEPKLGFALKTRGVTWDLEEFLGTVEQHREEVEQYKDLDEIDLSLDEIALNTAGHFLTLLVADISGVNSEELLHGIGSDDDDDEVFVFEQTEGGQGIVDLFFEKVQTKPHNVLRSMLRLLYNGQVMNERLWAEEDFIEDVQNSDARSDENIRNELVDTHLDVEFSPVIQRIGEELLGTLDKIDDVIDATDVDDVSRVYELKHDIAKARLDGHESLTREVKEDYSDLIDEAGGTDRIETLFVSPDIDGCAENLQLKTTLFNVEQSDSLSYVLLEALREDLLQTVPTDEHAEAMIEREQLWGGERDGEVVFPTF